MVEFYNLDEIQYESLKRMALADKPTPTLITEPHPESTVDENNLVKELTKKLLDMVSMGMIKETTHEEVNKGPIEEFEKQQGCKYRVFHITSLGRQMFERKNNIVN